MLVITCASSGYYIYVRNWSRTERLHLARAGHRVGVASTKCCVTLFGSSRDKHRLAEGMTQSLSGGRRCSPCPHAARLGARRSLQADLWGPSVEAAAAEWRDGTGSIRGGNCHHAWRVLSNCAWRVLGTRGGLRKELCRFLLRAETATWQTGRRSRGWVAEEIPPSPVLRGWNPVGRCSQRFGGDPRKKRLPDGGRGPAQ